MDLKIERFKDMTSLVAEKDEQRRRHKEWMDRQKELREFYNGQPIMTEEDADEENLEEITNHLIGYSNLQIIETRYYSIWSTSNKFIDVNVVDEDLEVHERSDQSEQINRFLNKAIYKTSRFGTFLRGVAGELSMAGRVACIHKEDSDWCPNVAPKLLLPDNVGTDASELTYAFTPVEMTYAELEALLPQEGEEDDDEEDDDGIEDKVTVNEPVVRQLLETIDQQLALNETQMATDSENEQHDPTNTDQALGKSNKTTVRTWRYFEVRFDEEKKHKVVDLLIFTDEYRAKSEEGEEAQKTETYEQIAHYPSYYERPSEWMNLIVIDASIGGDKRFSTAKGVAEITYNSDIDSEELLNRIFAGEKMRAMPRFQEGDGANEDALLGWNAEESTIVPKGVSEFRFGGGTGGLNNPLSLLQQNSSRQSGSAHSNSGRDGELRQQAVERQGNNQAANLSRTSDLYKYMEILAHEIVRRFFVGEVDPGSPGYEEIMWFRAMCKKKDIDLEKLSEQLFGFYENIEVKIVRSSSSGEIDHDLEVAREFMRNLSNFPAGVRPLIVKKFVSLVSGDPDFADDMVALLPKVVSAQRVTAESEFEQIRRDAMVGIDTPLGEDDVHTEHAETHNKHMQAIVNEGLIKPWTRVEAIHFAGLQVHQQKHIDELLLNDTTRAEGEQLLRVFQQLVNQGDEFLKEVERVELEQEGRSEQDIETQLKIREQTRKEQETAIKAADVESVIENRRQRRNDVRRQNDQTFALNASK